MILYSIFSSSDSIALQSKWARASPSIIRYRLIFMRKSWANCSYYKYEYSITIYCSREHPIVLFIFHFVLHISNIIHGRNYQSSSGWLSVTLYGSRFECTQKLKYHRLTIVIMEMRIEQIYLEILHNNLQDFIYLYRDARDWALLNLAKRN